MVLKYQKNERARKIIPLIQKKFLSNLKLFKNNIGVKLMSCPKNSSIIISDGSCILFFNT